MGHDMIEIEVNGERRHVEERTLTKKVGSYSNDNEDCQWQEWWLNGELVKRNAQMQLKKPAVFAEGVAGKFD